MLSKIKIPLGSIILGLTLLCFPWLWLQDYASQSVPDLNEKAIRVDIPRGVSLGEIKNILVEESLIRDDIRFEILALVLGYANSLKAGYYSINVGSSPLEILRLLEKGEVITFSLTIPEGYTIKQIGRLLAERFDYDQEKFRDLCHDPALIESLGLEVRSLEGYLFPETYKITKDQSLQSLIREMVKQFKRIYENLLATRDFSNTSSFSRHEIVTMASIVEKETALDAERPLVASVLVNRLHRNMFLQVDPTVIYGLDKFGKSLSNADLVSDTPYNSYLYKGLPPGPICSPGRAALSAALKPAETSYLYFVARNDGSHFFSKKLRDHINAVNRFQR